MPDNDLDAYLNPLTAPRSPRERVHSIASRIGLDPSIADDYLRLTRIESGQNINVRDSPKGAKGFGQVMPDRPGLSTRTIGNRRYNLRDPDENVEAGLRLFQAGGSDPVARRLEYFGGAGARRQYQRTGRIPNISDGNMTAAQYVRATGAQQLQSPTSDLDSYLDPVEQTPPVSSQKRVVQNPPASPKQSTTQSAPRTTPSYRQPFAPVSPETQAAIRAGIADAERPPIAPPPGRAAALLRQYGQTKGVENVVQQREAQTRAAVEQEYRARRGPYGSPTPTGALHLIANPIESLTGLFRSDEENINRETQERLKQQQVATEPEVESIRKEYGQMSAPVRSVVAPLARGGASLLSIAGGLANLGGMLPKGTLPPLDKLHDWAKKRAAIIETGASLPPLAEERGLSSLITGNAKLKEVERGIPEKVATGLADLGVGLGQIILLKKATNLPFNQLLALEAAAKSSDSPIDQQLGKAAEGYALGSALESNLSRGTNAALFGLPTAAQTGYEVSQGRMLPLDAAIQTGIQAGAGAVLTPSRRGRPSEVAQVELRPEPRVETSQRDTQDTGRQFRTLADVLDHERSLPKVEQDAFRDALAADPAVEKANAAWLAGADMSVLGEAHRRFAERYFNQKPDTAIERYLDGPPVQTQPPVETERAPVEPAAMAESLARPVQSVDRTVGEVAAPEAPARFFHRDYGEVIESPNQRGVSKGRVRVTAEDGTEHVIKRSAMTGAGNQRAVPIRPEPVAESAQAESAISPERKAQSAPVEIEKRSEPAAESSTTAVKNAAMASDRAARDLPELVAAEPRRAAEVHQRALDANTRDPRSVDRLVAQSLTGDKNLTDVETAQLRLRAQEIKNREGELLDELNSATDPQTIREKRTELDSLTEEFDQLSQATRKAGTEWGRAGVARQQAIDQDFSLVAMKARLKAAKRDVLTAAENARVEELERKLRAAEKRAEEAERQATQQESASAADKYVKEQRVKVRSQTRRTKEQLIAERSALKSELSALIEAPSVKEFLRNEKGELDPEKAGELTRVLRDLARNYIEDGVTKAEELVDRIHEHVKDVSDLTKREVSDLISGYGTIRRATQNPVERKLNEIKAILAATSGRADVLEESIRPLRRGQQREKPTEDQRRALRELNEAMREHGPELAREPYDPTTRQATPLDKAKTTTRNRIEQLNRWIAEGKRETQTRTEIIPDAELIRLRAERDALEQTASLLEDPKADDRAIEQRVKALEKSLTEVRQRVQSGQVEPRLKTGAKQLWSEEIGRLTKEREVLNGVLSDMRAEAKRKGRQATQPAEVYGQRMSWQEFEKAAQRELNRRKDLDKRAMEYERRIRERDFADKPKVKPQYTRETIARTKEVDALKAEYNKLRYQATRSFGGKLIDTGVGVGNIPKTLLSMADVSALLRQGGIGYVQHPVLSTRAARDMLTAFTSHGFANVEEAIKSNPKFDLARRSGVEFTGVDRNDPHLNRREEGYLGSGAIDTLAKGRANPLRAIKAVKDFSERTFVSFLDSQRMRIFEQQAQALRDMGLTGKELDTALKSQAKYINIITGRGSLGTEGNKYAPALNLAMFSPRLVASRFQFLNKMLNPVAWARMPSGARKLQMTDNVKFLVGTAAVLGLAKAAGANVNLDPDDADFLKIKVGNTRFDTLTGLQQPLRFTLRMAKAIRGGKTYSGDPKGDILADFARSKASPEIGLGWDFFAGQNRLSGKRFEPSDVGRNLIPLPLQDFAESIKEDGALRGSVEALPSLLGVGVQTYKGAAEKPTTEAEKLARRFLRNKLPDEARDQEQIDLDTKKSELRARARRGEDVTSDLATLKGKITDRQAKAILAARNRTRLQEDVNRLGIKDALLVYSVANPQQRAELRDLLTKKAPLADVLPPDEQAKVRAKLVDYGISGGRPARPLRQSRPSRAER